MNGFKLQADSYRMYLEKHPDEPNRESLERTIKANDIMATFTQEDIYALYDTGAFNEIAYEYCKKAMEQSGISSEQISAVMSEMKWLYDTVDAATVSGVKQINIEEVK